MREPHTPPPYAAGCCGDGDWRGRLCRYHTGFRDALDLADLESLPVAKRPTRPLYGHPALPLFGASAILNGASTALFGIGAGLFAVLVTTMAVVAGVLLERYHP